MKNIKGDWLKLQEVLFWEKWKEGQERELALYFKRKKHLEHIDNQRNKK